METEEDYFGRVCPTYCSIIASGVSDDIVYLSDHLSTSQTHTHAQTHTVSLSFPAAEHTLLET